MHESYPDIMALTDAAPQWWDSNAVPRYCEPHPDRCPNIYATKVLFMTIACQHEGCGQEFLVEMHEGPYDVARGYAPLEERKLEWGDPPNTGCCGSGATMSSVPIRVESYWVRAPRAGGWNEVPAGERPEVAAEGWWNDPANDEW